MLIPPAGLASSLLRLLPPEKRRQVRRAIPVPGIATALDIGEAALTGAEFGLRTIARGVLRLGEFFERQKAGLAGVLEGVGAEAGMQAFENTQGRVFRQLDEALQRPIFREDIPEGPEADPEDNVLSYARKVWHFVRRDPERGAQWLAFQVGQSLPVTAAVVGGAALGGPVGAGLAVGTTLLSSAGEVGGEKIEARDLPLIALHAGIEYVSDLVTAAAAGIGLDDAAKAVVKRYAARLMQRFPTLSVANLERAVRRFAQTLAVAGSPITEGIEEGLQSGIESLSRGEGFKVDPASVVSGALVGGVLGPGATIAGSAVEGAPRVERQTGGDGAALPQPQPAIPPESPFVQQPVGPAMEEVGARVAAREIPYHLYVPENATVRRTPDNPFEFEVTGRSVAARILVRPAPNMSAETFIPRIRDEGTFEVAPGKIVQIKPLQQIETRLDAAELENTPIEHLTVEDSPEDVSPEFQPLISKPVKDIDVDELARLPIDEALKHSRLARLYFQGAPPTVKTVGDITRLARHIARLAVLGQEGRWWYEKSALRIAQMFGLPVRLPAEVKVSLTPEEQELAERLQKLGRTERLQEARKFTALLAAFSPNSSPDQNWMNAVLAYHQYLQQRRLRPEGPFKIDIGATGTPTAERILNAQPGQEEEFLGNKTRAFYRNLTAILSGQGDDSVTVDLWVYRAMGYPKGSREAPNNYQYAFTQRLVQDVAGALGWTPMQVQAALWTAERTLFQQQAQKAFDLYARLQRGEITWQDFERERTALEREGLRLGTEERAVLAMPGTIVSDDFAEVVDTRSLQFSLETVRGWRNFLRPDTPYEVYEAFTRDMVPLIEQTLRDVGLEPVGPARVLPGYWGGTDFNPSVQVRLATPTRFAQYQADFLNRLLNQEGDDLPAEISLRDGLERLIATPAKKVYRRIRKLLRETGHPDEAALAYRKALQELGARRDESGLAEFIRHVAGVAVEKASTKDAQAFLTEIAESSHPGLSVLRLLDGMIAPDESAEAALEALKAFRKALWQQTREWFADPTSYPVDSGAIAAFWSHFAAVLPPEWVRQVEVAAGVLNMIFDQQAIGWHVINASVTPTAHQARGLHLDVNRALTREEIVQLDGILRRYLGEYGWIGTRQEGAYVGFDEDRREEIFQAFRKHFTEIHDEIAAVLGDQVSLKAVLSLSGLEENPQIEEENGRVAPDSEAIARIARRWSGLDYAESTARVTGLVSRGRATAARILLERYGDYVDEEAREALEVTANLGEEAGRHGAVGDVLREPGPAFDVAAGTREEADRGDYRDVASGWKDLPVGARIHALWRRLGYRVPGGGMAEILRAGKERLVDAFGLRTAAERRHFRRVIDAFVRYIRIEDEPEYKVLLADISEVFRPSGMELIGRSVQSYEDLIKLLAVYRNPHIEISRVLIINKKGQILHEMATTAWSPVYTWVAMGGFASVSKQLQHLSSKVRTWHDMMNELLDYYEQKTGDRVGVVFVHNHPSGDASPSEADINVTDYLAQSLGDRFIGSVVIDSGEAAIIEVLDEFLNVYPIRDPEALPEIREPLKIAALNAILAEQARRSREAVTFIAVHPGRPLGTTGVVSMQLGDFKRKVLKNPQRELRRIMLRLGASNLLLIGPSEIAPHAEAWRQKGWIGDFLGEENPSAVLGRTMAAAVGVSTLVRDLETIEEDEGFNLYVTENLPVDEDELADLPRRKRPEELANPARRADVRQLVHQVDRVMRDLMDYPDPETFEQWDEEGQALLRRPSERQRIERGEIYTAADVMAAKRLIDRIGMDAIRKAYRGDLSELEHLIDVVVGYRMARTDIARALAAGRDPVRGPAERYREFALQALTNPTRSEQRLLRKLARAEQRQEIMQQIRERTIKTLQDLQLKGIELDKVDWSNPLEAAHVIREIQAVRSEWSEKIYEYWINAILSAPSTHLVNTVSNLLMTTSALVIERPLQAMLNDLLIKDPELPTLGELPIIYKAVIKKALPIALYRARLAFKSELGILDDEIQGSTRSKTEVPTVAIGGTIGRIVRIPKRLLLFSDEIFKNLAFYAQKAALLYRAGKAYQLKGRDLERFVWEGIEEDTTGIDQAAYQFALKQVFQEDVPSIVKSVIRFRKDHLIFRFLFPFLVTPTNVFRRAVRYTWPGTIILAWRLARRGISREEALERVVQNAIGWFVFWAIWMLSSDDDDDPRRTIITGSTSIARGARDLAYRARPPRSVRIGGKWWSYSRLDPIATVLQIWVDAVDLIRAGAEDPERALQRAWESTTGIVTDKTFLATLDDLALMPLDPGGTVLRMVQRYSTSFVPALLRSIIRSSDTVLRDVRPSGQGIWWTKDLFEKAFKGALAPWMLQPRVDLWGRPISTKVFEAPITDFLFRLLTPVQARQVNVHPADIVLLRWNQQHPQEQYHPVLPDREFTYKGRTFWMPDDVYYKFLRTAGQIAAVELAAIFRDIPERPTREHIETIERTIAKARAMARKAIVYEHEPELIEQEPQP